MKIGILTFHKAYNYGARLQCYSLQERLKEVFPSSDIHIINYNSQKMYDEYHHKEKIYNTPKLVQLKIFAKKIINFKHLRRVNIFEKSKSESIDEINVYLNVDDEGIISNDIIEFSNYVNEKAFDVIIVGSDAVWNDNQSFSPNPYFLMGVNCCNKLSYAASSYGFDYKKLSPDILNNYIDAIQGFRYVGVRDEETCKYVNCLNAPAVYHNCDPTIFLELQKIPVDRKNVERKMREKGIDLSKPIIGVMGADWLAKQVKKCFGKNYQIVCLFEYNKYSDFYLDNLNPFEWTIVFSYFTATFTHYFHATIFSLKNLTLTFSVERDNQYNTKYKSKIYDLLERMGILGICYYRCSNNNFKDTFKKIKAIVNKEKTFIYDYKKTIGDALQREMAYCNTFFENLEVIKNEQQQ